jgi:hypothetical protein
MDIGTKPIGERTDQAVTLEPSAATGFDKLRASLRSHREFLLILVLAVVFRFTAVLVFRPGGYLGELSNFGYYRLLLDFTNMGFYPFVDFWLEYPPVFPWLMLGLYRLSLLIPPWSQPGTWFYLSLSTFFAVVEAGNLVLLYGIARRLYDRDQAVRVAWIYTALLNPVLTMFGAFDGLGLFFLLLAVLLTLDRRAVASGAAVGLGFMTKLLPITAVPAALQHMKRASQRVKLLGAAAITILLIAAPFLVIAPDYLIQSLRSPMLRASWETVWALVDGYYSYGVAGGWDRFDPLQAGAAQHDSQLPWTVITIGFGLVFLFLYTRRVDWADRRRVVAFTALTQNLLVLYAKGYSPQFLIMLLPFIILLIRGWRGVAYALLLSVINVVEFPIYFLLLPNQHWLLAGTVLLRTLILIVVSFEYAISVCALRIPHRWKQAVAIGVVMLVGILGVVGLIFGFEAYYESRYAASPHRPAIDILVDQVPSGTRVVVDAQETFEHLFPFLHKRLELVAIEVHSYLPPWEPRLADAAARSTGQLWVYASADSPLHAWLAERYTPLASHEFDGWRLSGWDIR